MKRIFVLFIIIFLCTSLWTSRVIFTADKVAVRVNDSVLTMEEFEKKLDDKDSKEVVVKDFLNRQAERYLVEEKDELEVTDEMVYEQMEWIKSKIPSTGENPVKENPSLEEIAQWLASFTTESADWYIKGAHTLAIYNVVDQFYKDKAENELKKGSYDDWVAKKHQERIDYIEERKKQKITDKQVEEYMNEVGEVLNMSTKEYRNHKFDELKDELAQKLKDNAREKALESLDVEINVDLSEDIL